MASKTIPEGFHSVTPFLMVNDPRRVIDFLKATFGAVENSYHDLGGGHVHAEVTIGDSRIMMGKTETTPAYLYVYVPDCDGTLGCPFSPDGISFRRSLSRAVGTLRSKLRGDPLRRGLSRLRRERPGKMRPSFLVGAPKSALTLRRKMGKEN